MDKKPLLSGRGFLFEWSCWQRIVNLLCEQHPNGYYLTVRHWGYADDSIV